jgi:hypothetical protein
VPAVTQEVEQAYGRMAKQLADDIDRLAIERFYKPNE